VTSKGIGQLLYLLTCFRNSYVFIEIVNIFIYSCYNKVLFQNSNVIYSCYNKVLFQNSNVKTFWD